MILSVGLAHQNLVEGGYLTTRVQSRWPAAETGELTSRRVGILSLTIALAITVVVYLWAIVGWFGGDALVSLSTVASYVSDFFFIVGILVWGLGWYRLGTPKMGYGPRYVFLPALVVFALIAMSVPWMNDPASAGLTTVRWFGLLLLYVALLNEPDRWSVVRPTARRLWRTYAETDVYEQRLGTLSLAVAIATSSMNFKWLWVESYTRQIAEYGGFVFYLADGFLLTGLVLWMLGWLKAGRPRLSFGRWYVFGPLFVLLVLGALTIPFAFDPLQAGITIGRRLTLFALYIAMVNESRRSQAMIIGIILAMGALQAAVGLAQMAISGPVGLTFLAEKEQGNPVWPIGDPRAYGLAGNPTPLAMHLGAYASIAFGALLVVHYRRRTRMVVFAISMLTLAGLVASGGRAAIAGWLFGIILLTVFALTRRRNVSKAFAVRVLLAVGAVLVLAGAATSFVDRGGLSRITPAVILQDITRRYTLDYDRAIPIIQDNPIIGVGAGNYAQVLSKRLEPRPDGKPRRVALVHSSLLLVASEQGLISAAALVMVFIAPLLWGIFHWRNLGEDPSSLIWVGAVFSILAMTVTDFGPWGFPTGRMLFWGVLGLWAGSFPLQPNQAEAAKETTE